MSEDWDLNINGAISKLLGTAAALVTDHPEIAFFTANNAIEHNDKLHKSLKEQARNSRLTCLFEQESDPNAFVDANEVLNQIIRKPNDRSPPCYPAKFEPDSHSLKARLESNQWASFLGLGTTAAAGWQYPFTNFPRWGATSTAIWGVPRAPVGSLISEIIASLSHLASRISFAEIASIGARASFFATVFWPSPIAPDPAPETWTVKNDNVSELNTSNNPDTVIAMSVAKKQL